MGSCPGAPDLESVRGKSKIPHLWILNVGSVSQSTGSTPCIGSAWLFIPSLIRGCIHHGTLAARRLCCRTEYSVERQSCPAVAMSSVPLPIVTKSVPIAPYNIIVGLWRVALAKRGKTSGVDMDARRTCLRGRWESSAVGYVWRLRAPSTLRIRT